jgi:ribosome modulation factor
MPEDNVEAAWQSGHEAGRARQALLSNPYPTGTAAFKAWQAGWREAEGQGRPGDQAPPSETP